MHAFNLAMQSVVSHKVFATFLSQCQKVVTFVRSSHGVLTTVQVTGQAMGIHTTLASSNKTRFTSSARSVRSVKVLHPALQAVVLSRNDLFKTKTGAEAAAILREPSFLHSCILVGELLEPFEKVIMAIQGKDATLSDVTRYWMYLTIQMGLVCVKFNSCKYSDSGEGWHACMR